MRRPPWKAHQQWTVVGVTASRCIIWPNGDPLLGVQPPSRGLVSARRRQISPTSHQVARSPTSIDGGVNSLAVTRDPIAFSAFLFLVLYAKVQGWFVTSSYLAALSVFRGLNYLLKKLALRRLCALMSYSASLRSKHEIYECCKPNAIICSSLPISQSVSFSWEHFIRVRNNLWLVCCGKRQSPSLLAASMLSFLILTSTEHKNKIKLNMIVRKWWIGRRMYWRYQFLPFDNCPKLNLASSILTLKLFI
jgi:hypothetical protein